MKYNVHCLACKHKEEAKNKKEALKARSKHRRENSCDWFLEIASNVIIEAK